MKISSANLTLAMVNHLENKGYTVIPDGDSEYVDVYKKEPVSEPFAQVS